MGRISQQSVVGQVVDLEKLLGAFDEVRREHECMQADTFNDDGTYKNRLNQVLSGLLSCLRSTLGFPPLQAHRSY